MSTIRDAQSVWDECLIYGARADISMGNLVWRFLLEVKPDLVENNGDFKDRSQVANFINSLELRRCRDKNRDGILEFHVWKGPVTAFIGERSPIMLACIFNKKHAAIDILENINSFKWTRKGIKHINNIQRRKQRRKSASCERTVKARSLDKRYDWSTIK